MSVPETPNLHLKKPAYTNAADVFDMNDNMDTLDQAIPDLWKTIYPVGSIFMSVNSTSPATLFGGTWVQIKDRFLLSAGDTYTAGSTGGAATKSYTPAGTVGNHTLTVNEIPSHDHGMNNHTHTYDKVNATTQGPSTANTSGPSTANTSGPSTSVTGSTVLTIDQIPSHTHNMKLSSVSGTISGTQIYPIMYQLNDAGVGTAATGGSAGHTHTLSDHTHTLSNHTHTLSSHTHNISTTSKTTGQASGNTGAKGGGGSHNHGFTGTAASINVMPPYLTVYMWRGTA